MTARETAHIDELVSAAKDMSPDKGMVLATCAIALALASISNELGNISLNLDGVGDQTKIVENLRSIAVSLRSR